MISEVDLNPSLTKEEKKAHASRDKVLDDLKAIKEELDRKDLEKKKTKEIDVLKKALFPKWVTCRMDKEAIQKVEFFWLETISSLSVENSQECQLDFPMMPKAFMFRSLDKPVDVPMSNLAISKTLFNFYAKQSKP